MHLTAWLPGRNLNDVNLTCRVLVLKIRLGWRLSSGTIKWRECREKRKDFWIDPECIIIVITYLWSVVVTSSLGRRAQGTYPDLQNKDKVSLGWKHTFLTLVKKGFHGIWWSSLLWGISFLVWCLHET